MLSFQLPLEFLQIGAYIWFACFIEVPQKNLNKFHTINGGICQRSIKGKRKHPRIEYSPFLMSVIFLPKYLAVCSEGVNHMHTVTKITEPLGAWLYRGGVLQGLF